MALPLPPETISCLARVRSNLECLYQVVQQHGTVQDITAYANAMMDMQVVLEQSNTATATKRNL